MNRKSADLSRNDKSENGGIFGFPYVYISRMSSTWKTGSRNSCDFCQQLIQKRVSSMKLMNRHQIRTFIIEFENTKENGLGIPLPAGVFKMYRTNPVDGSAEFIGEYAIKHTEVNDKVRLKSGEACDIEVKAKKSGKFKEGGYEYTEYEYSICNTKGTPVEAIIRQQVPGHLWTVDESTHEWQKKRDKILLAYPCSCQCRGKGEIYNPPRSFRKKDDWILKAVEWHFNT